MVEHDRRVAENKIAVAGDEAVAKILARRAIDKKRVLITEHPDVIENGAVGAGTHRQARRKILVRERILERQVPRHEPDGCLLNLDDFTVIKSARVIGA